MIDTNTRRALQPLWNALDEVKDAVFDGAVLGVSGGPDSRALLESWALWGNRPQTTTVCCVDHGVREGSAAEAHAVVARASTLGLDGHIANIVAAKGDEASLRTARYQTLHDLARARGYSTVVVAHHEGDVAEGLLLHVAGQGGGRFGRAPRTVEIFDDGVRRVRPFLRVTRTTLHAALTALGITDVVVDSDDVAGRNARARLRQRLLAPLQEARPDVEAALARHARLLRDDDDVLEGLVPDTNVVEASLAPALLRRWLRRQIGAHVDDPRTSAAAIDTVLSLAARGQPGKVAVRGGEVTLSRVQGTLMVAVGDRAGQS